MKKLKCETQQIVKEEIIGKLLLSTAYNIYYAMMLYEKFCAEMDETGFVTV